jgi:hypothetical protein
VKGDTMLKKNNLLEKINSGREYLLKEINFSDVNRKCSFIYVRGDLEDLVSLKDNSFRLTTGFDNYLENPTYKSIGAFIDKYVSLMGVNSDELKLEAANSLNSYLKTNDSSHLENFYVLENKNKK